MAGDGSKVRGIRERGDKIRNTVEGLGYERIGISSPQRGSREEGWMET